MVLCSPTRIPIPWRSILHRLEKPLTGLFITLSLAVAASPYLPLQATEVPASLLQAPVDQSTPAENSTRYQTLSDGVYLYGQSPEPEQIGSAYMVFQVTQHQVVGAFYMPYSSFDCFHGEFQADQLVLNVVDSYEQTVHPYAIALQPDSSVASTDSETNLPLGLEGFHRLQTIGENDQRILATCQADYEQQN